MAATPVMQTEWAATRANQAAWMEGAATMDRASREGSHRAKIASLEDILSALSIKRPAFYSEKDFQLHLAWEMKQNGWELSMDYDPHCSNANMPIALFIEKPERIAIELKYRTASCPVQIEGRPFQLKNQGELHQARYDFFKQISRIEQVIAAGQADKGYVIFLTNESSYWRTPRPSALTSMFRMSQGHRAWRGPLQWAAGAAKRATRGRAEPVQISHNYVLNWNPYANMGTETGVFRYLLLEVPPRN